ncbi:MAG: exopolyphosphatase / guanosine-5-triphosphate,3-diphosphate pyrophosphatase [Solirubrobacteraceae bacterium]|nr:exopolyphosphatase / guanosine-5-triphosphate,3-diphosphate pyrophosphatase [Solirubrobacteraceae bacterium]
MDLGTNSTRLFIAEVAADGTLTEILRESTVTRLGDRVDATGRLADDAMLRVFETLDRYRAQMDEHGVHASVALLTSAARDAENGPAFTAEIAARYRIDARTIDGDTEASLTFAGATSERPDDGTEVVVVDIGGGSTEFVVGRDGVVDFHVSTQAGVVRQTERHLHDDPPDHEGLVALAGEVAAIIAAAIPQHLRDRVNAGIAVAGTATSCAAIELALDPYDPAKVHGHILELGTLELELARLAQMDNDARREVVGLHPDRAPTIVAGVVLMIEVMRAFGLERIEASDHDILRGAALALAARDSG